MNTLRIKKVEPFRLLLETGICFVLLVFIVPEPSHSEIMLDYVPLTSQLSKPLLITNAGDGSDRLFVVEQHRGIRIIHSQGNLDPTPFLELGPNGLDRLASTVEEGFLGLAFHPDYANNGKFYVHYNRKPETGDPGPANPGPTIIAEYTVSADPNIANPTERIILGPIAQVLPDHNGGTIKFSPIDGFLYISLGDGGNGLGADANGQNTSQLLGKMLRIDVDSGIRYAIPADNLFAGGGGRREIYAYGLRNPYRFSFDRETGRLFAGDVGSAGTGAFDEVNLIRNGGNYGWRIMEGFNCRVPGCDLNQFDLPIAVLQWGIEANSITGGYVYRGQSFPNLRGLYIFADYISGKMYSLEQTGPDDWEKTFLDDTPYLVSAFGEDEAGELYLAHYGGVIYKINDVGPVMPTHTPFNTATPTVTRTLTTTIPTITPTLFVDNDDDGISNPEEEGAPNNGDGNNDGTADSQQEHVTSLLTINENAYFTLAAPPGIELKNVFSLDQPDPELPANTIFPEFGLSFQATGLNPGESVVLQLFVPAGKQYNSVYKHGGGSYYDFSFDGTTGAQQDQDVFDLHFVDGNARGDNDSLANGIINDPAFPAFVTPPTPTSSGTITPTPTNTPMTSSLKLR